MTDVMPSVFAYDDGDIDTNPTINPTLSTLVEERYSRRQTLMGGISAITAATFGGGMLAACGGGGGGGNAVPNVNAGATGTAGAGQVVTLTGTATDSDGTVSSVSWTQVSGPTVTINNANGNVATFLAPSVTAATALVFRFSAFDNGGSAASADTTVNVSPAALGFAAVAKSLADVVSVPTGYTVTVLYRTGDPLLAGVSAYANNGTDTNFAGRAGDHHDGMSFFGLAATGTARDDTSNTRGLLVMNHENVAGTQVYLHPNGPTGIGSGVRPEAEAIKEIEAHGVSVVEVTRAGASGAWTYVQGGTLNRRITPLTPTVFSGPARGSALLRTVFSPTGVAGRGTLNNCANGYTAWGTYFTNEENWAGYLRRDAGDVALRTAKENVSLNRYGLGVKRGNFDWAFVVSATAQANFSKFNITSQAGQPADGTGDYRNEGNQLGWVVEIDPYNAATAPRKRTALGRMNHEGCWPGPFTVGRKPAFYMGDDAQNEYLYKFVSNTAWVAADATGTDSLAIGDKYLDAGTLYVARFNADGSGTWLPLVFGQNGLTAANTTYAFADQADVLINTRLAADVVGATAMDRPEWTAINPRTGEMYLTLTKNTARTPLGGTAATRATDAANPRAYQDVRANGTNGSVGNPQGHVLRLRETGDTTEATTFSWDIYAFGAKANANATNVNLSGLDATNDFSSPDGLWFSRPSNAGGSAVTPLLWIQTDDGDFTDVTNNQMLVATPGTVNDGGNRTVSNSLGGQTSTITTKVGANPGTRLRRFLVGPKECEITGIDSTPDGRSVFVNIQHPGENGTATAPTSNWPASQTGAVAATTRPRSATIVITKNDGGVVGL